MSVEKHPAAASVPSRISAHATVCVRRHGSESDESRAIGGPARKVGQHPCEPAPRRPRREAVLLAGHAGITVSVTTRLPAGTGFQGDTFIAAPLASIDTRCLPG